MIDRPDPVYKITMRADKEYFHHTRELVHFISKQHGMGDSEADVVEMAVSEAWHNVLRHTSTEKNRSRCKLEIIIDSEALRAVITNRGEAFEFDSIEPFDIHQDFMRYKDGGLGIPLIKVLMDEVRYNRRSGNMNELTLIKYFNPGAK